MGFEDVEVVFWEVDCVFDDVDLGDCILKEEVLMWFNEVK